MTVQEVLALIEKENVKMVDLRFMDFVGTWQHCTYPAHELTEEIFEDGMGFDGSSIRGWKAIQNSDMIFIPDPETARIDPFSSTKTLILICNIFDPITKEPYTRDPRSIANKSINYMKSIGIADTCFIGPEPEFFVFDNVQYAYSANEGFFHFDQ
jgi:glutamine synthetase